MGSPVDYAKLADQIMAYTKVSVTPLEPDVGQRMTVETVPGILPFLPSDLAGTLNLPVTGAVNVLLESLVKAVKFTVKYKVKMNGADAPSQPVFEPLTPMNLPDSDPLLALFRIPPPLVPEEGAQTLTPAELVATISLDLEGNQIERDVTVPLQLTAIPIPTLLVLKSDPNDEDWPSSKIFLMVRLGSAMQSASAVIQKVNDVIQLVNSVKDVLGFSVAVVDLFVGGLQEALDAAQTAGFSIAGLAVEEAPDLDDFDDFDDEARSSILIGPIGTKIHFYSGEEYNGLALGDNEVSTFEITPDHDFGKSAGVVTGFGIHRVTSFRDRNWDTDPSDDDMDDVESCNFGEMKPQ
jgi:hypothetical protein